ncbi:MAG: hypothetical protein HY735_00295 [Verrucomicrobia bacterium]|nr:hypothetical protein [Verrucomicrobiota bacterium]
MSITHTVASWARLTALALTMLDSAATDAEQEIPLAQLGQEPCSFAAKADESGRFTWWLPDQADALVLPVSAGTLIETDNEPLMRWLREV